MYWLQELRRKWGKESSFPWRSQCRFGVCSYNHKRLHCAGIIGTLCRTRRLFSVTNETEEDTWSGICCSARLEGASSTSQSSPSTWVAGALCCIVHSITLWIHIEPKLLCKELVVGFLRKCLRVKWDSCRFRFLHDHSVYGHQICTCVLKNYLCQMMQFKKLSGVGEGGDASIIPVVSNLALFGSLLWTASKPFCFCILYRTLPYLVGCEIFF